MATDTIAGRTDAVGEDRPIREDGERGCRQIVTTGGNENSKVRRGMPLDNFYYRAESTEGAETGNNAGTKGVAVTAD